MPSSDYQPVSVKSIKSDGTDLVITFSIPQSLHDAALRALRPTGDRVVDGLSYISKRGAFAPFCYQLESFYRQVIDYLDDRQNRSHGRRR